MKITREIIEDLLPLYVAGDVSQDTKTLVESYLETDPELASLIRSASEDFLPGQPPTTFSMEAEMKSMQQTKRMLSLKSLSIAGALFFTLTCFSFQFTGHGGAIWLFANSPKALAVCASLGLISWIAYFRIRTKYRY